MKDLPSKEKQNPTGTDGTGRRCTGMEVLNGGGGKRGIRKRIQGGTDNTKSHFETSGENFLQKKLLHTHKTCVGMGVKTNRITK